MSLTTIPAFYYGYEITSDNNNININEGSGELLATISNGKYSLTDFVTAVKTALDAASTLPQAYTVSVNRTTRQITIASAANFDILIDTGSQSGTSPYTLMGFTGSSDLTSTTTYTGDSASGSSYIPQFWLQSYTDKDHFQELIDASVNESANGDIETVSFGTRKFVEFELKFITDKPGDGKVIRNNPSGVADCVSFFQEITKKGNFEFIPDKDSPSTFDKVILESTPSSSKGIGYKLKEMVNQSLPGYYETGSIKLRVI